MPNWKSKASSTISAVMFIALGWFGSIAWNEIARPYAQSERSVNCLKHNACVGQTAEKFLLSYDDDLGGLTAIFCDDDWMFLSDIVFGKSCASENYALEFRNPSRRTLVSIEGGTIRSIVVGSLHTIDF